MLWFIVFEYLLKYDYNDPIDNEQKLLITRLHVKSVWTTSMLLYSVLRVYHYTLCSEGAPFFLIRTQSLYTLGLTEEISQ